MALAHAELFVQEQPGDDLHAWVHTNLVYRDHKTLAYRVACLLVLFSMACCQVAIIVALLQL